MTAHGGSGYQGWTGGAGTIYTEIFDLRLYGELLVDNSRVILAGHTPIANENYTFDRVEVTSGGILCREVRWPV